MLEGSLEENVLTLLCYDEVYAADLTARFKPDIFSTKGYRKIAERAFQHIEKFSAPPGAHLRDLCEADLRRGDDGKLLKQTLDAMEELHKGLQPDFVLDQLDNFVESRKMLNSIAEASDALMRGDLPAARDLLYSRDNAPKTGKGLKLSDSKAVLAFLDQTEEDFISIGIEALDDRGVRPEPKTMTLMIAPAKAGKTWWMIEVGKRGFLHRKNVAHITLEMSEEKVARRYAQSLFGMTKDRAESVRVPQFKRDDIGRFVGFEYDTLAPEQISQATRPGLARKLRAMGTRAPIIKEFPTSSLTIPQLNAFLDQCERDGFPIDLLILDYADLMALDSKDLRVSTGNLYKQLRGVAVARNLALVTASQGNRSTASSKVVKSDQVAEDWSKIGTADTIITYSQTVEEKRAGLARILVANARDVDGGWIALISQAYATGQFCIDSVYMGKQVEDEMKKFTGSEDEDD